MAQNFIECDREQVFLMPPSLREWLAEDHLAWFVLEAVEAMDLTEFYGDYRSDGHGRAAYEPSMMVALLLYAYATKQRSSRGIEIHCRQDVAYRVIAANRVPDHATIARFLVRHEAALARLFGSVLRLCAKAGLVSTGVVAIDGTKLAANASREANLDYERIAREIVAEAKATDEAEDELFGDARGDELPEELQTSAGRRKWLREAKQALEQERTTDPPQAALERAEEPALMPRGRALNQGRRGWLRDARQRLDERRAQKARAVPRSRQARLAESRRRLEQELMAERRANENLRGLSRARDQPRRAPLRRRPAESPPRARQPGLQAQHNRPRLCDDIESTMRELRDKGVAFDGSVADQPWGRVRRQCYPAAAASGCTNRATRARCLGEVRA